MNIVLWFGSNETHLHESLWIWILDTFKEVHNNNKEEDRYGISDKTLLDFKWKIEEYQKEIWEKYKIDDDKSTPRPERYYNINYGLRVARDYDTLFVRVVFWHINSRHPMSPDGMALRKIPIDYVYNFEDIEE